MESETLNKTAELPPLPPPQAEPELPPPPPPPEAAAAPVDAPPAPAPVGAPGGAPGGAAETAPPPPPPLAAAQPPAEVDEPLRAVTPASSMTMPMSMPAAQPLMSTAMATAAALPASAALSRKRSLPEPPAPEEAQKALKVEDALTYLDKVKTQFGDQPHIYNKFLDIMKNFKAETIDTPGVIRHVQALFRGHNNLILGFNTFLPPGCRIELSHLPPDGTELQRPGSGMAGLSQLESAPMMAAAAAAAAAHGYPPQAFFYGQPAPYMSHGYMMPGQMVMAGMGGQGQPGLSPQAQAQLLQQQQVQMQQQAQAQAQAQQQQHEDDGQNPQPVEFDQAISYVTKIKRRFQHDPDTYKSFLEILHTYQKEQKSIKEVLDQVAELFRDHSDLLREFTYFLPDNVRDKAKQEIARISARRSKEEQRNKEKKPAAERKPRPQGNKRELGDGPGMGGGNVGGPSMPPRASGTAGLRSGRGGAEFDEDVLYFEGHIPKLERRLFARIKSALASRERWAEFLKCLHLFSQEVISRAELVALAADIFVSHPELLDELDRLLASRGATDNNDEDAWYSMPLSDIDFSQSRRCTPSYRALPPSYPKLPCSERTALCRSVLNDTWVSVPTGSEDFSFKSMRKNVYEEALFKCEDDRYEFDMVIDANMSTIRVLEALQTEIHDSSNNNATFRYQLDKRALSVIHLKAIVRVYGSRGAEILELLGKAPATAIPVILVRLKQKDEEWRRQRIELNKEWKEILERNYHKSLDHRSFYFKQNEKKALSQKTLLAEIKDAPEHKMLLDFGDAFAHRSASQLIALWAEKTLQRADAEKLVSTLDRFVTGFKASRPRGSSSSSQPAVAPRLTVGAKVFTRYGPGTVSGLSAAAECTVRLDKDTVVTVPLGEALVEDSVAEAAWEFNNIFVGTAGYTFLRMYHVLCQRLAQADALCQVVNREPAKTAVKHVVEREHGETSTDKDAGASERFTQLMESIRALLSSQVDSNKFEEDCCALLGSGSFFIFTIDKLVGSCARAVQALVQDEKATRVADLLVQYKQSKTANNAAALYRAVADALSAGSAACVQMRLLPGVKPVSKPAAADDALWETPRLELAFLDAIPYTSKPPPGFVLPRSASPVLGDPTDMGEINTCVPWRVKIKAMDVAALAAPPAAAAAAATTTTAVETATRKATRSDDTKAEVVVVTGVFLLEHVVGSDDVFRRIAQHDDRDSPWWRIEAAKEAMDVEEPDEDDDDSGEGNGKAGKEA